MLVVHTTAKENLMAVPKLRKLGQEDSEEQKQPQPQRYMVRPMGGDETEPTQMTEKNPNHFNVQPQESMGMPQIHIHMAPTQMKGLPIYDEGGVPDTSNFFTKTRSGCDGDYGSSTFKHLKNQWILVIMGTT